MVVVLRAGAGQPLPDRAAGAHVDRGEVPRVGRVAAGLAVDVEQPGPQRHLGHRRRRDDLRGPLHTAVAPPHPDAGDARGRGAAEHRGGRVLVAVVVLRQDRAARRDQAVLGRGRALGEHRGRAHLARAGDPAAPVVGHDVHPRVGVVGDHDQVLADQGRRGARALGELAGLLHRAAVVALAPGHLRRPRRGRVEAVERVVADDVDAAGLVGGEGVHDLLPREAQRADPAGRAVDRADAAGLGDEPDPAVPVGHERDQAVAVGDRGVGVVGPLLREAVLGHLHDEHGAVDGLDDRAVAVVEVEVRPSAQVAERVVARGQVALRGLHRGLRLERVGVDEHELEPVEPAAESDQPATAVEGHGRALDDAVRRAGDLEVTPERAAALVGVGGVGVVVHRVEAGARHERVPRHVEGVDRPVRRRPADERRRERVGRAGRDGHDGGARRRPRGPHEGGQREGGGGEA